MADELKAVPEQYKELIGVYQEIANRGMQDTLPEENRLYMDELVKRGYVSAKPPAETDQGGFLSGVEKAIYVLNSPGRMARANVIANVKGDSREEAAAKGVAAFLGDDEVLSSFADAAEQYMDNEAQKPEKDRNPVINVVNQHPHIRAGLAMVGWTADLLTDPVNYLPLGLFTKTARAGTGKAIEAGAAGFEKLSGMKVVKPVKQKYSAFMAERKKKQAEELVQKINKSFIENVEVKKLNPTAAMQRAIKTNDADSILLSEIHKEYGLAVDDKAVVKLRDPAKPRSETDSGWGSFVKEHKFSPEEIVEARMKQDSFLSSVKGIADKTFVALYKELGAPLWRRVEDISPKIGATMRRELISMNKKLHEDVTKISPFLFRYSQMTKPIQAVLTNHLNNGRFKEAVEMMPSDMAENFNKEVIPLLQERFKTLEQVSPNLEALSNYFPRSVKDVKGLRNANGIPEWATDSIQKKLDEFLAKEERPANDMETAMIISRILLGPEVKVAGRTITAEEKRALKNVGLDLQRYYGGADEALLGYLRDVHHASYVRNFMGKVNPKILKDLDAAGTAEAMKKMVGYELDNGAITQDEIMELRDLLKARFIGGETQNSKAVSRLKALAYVSTIANPFAASKQSGDIGVTAFVTGPLAAARGAANVLAGKNAHKYKDAGFDLLADLSHERNIPRLDPKLRSMKGVDVKDLVGVAASKLTLNEAMSVSGFRLVDHFGKNSFMESRMLQLAEMPERQRRLALRKYIHSYDDEAGFNSMIADFGKKAEGGPLTEEMKYVLTSELLEVQPIALESMPKAYLEAGGYLGGSVRLAWILQSYGLKQLDLLLNTAGKDFKQGRVMEGTAKMFYWFSIVGGANTAAQIPGRVVAGALEGKDTKEIFKDDPNLLALVAMNAVKASGTWEMLGDIPKRGSLKEYAGDMVPPPLEDITQLLVRTGKSMAGEKRGGLDRKSVNKHLVRRVPVVGEAAYHINKRFEPKKGKQVGTRLNVFKGRD